MTRDEEARQLNELIYGNLQCQTSARVVEFLNSTVTARLGRKLFEVNKSTFANHRGPESILMSSVKPLRAS